MTLQAPRPADPCDAFKSVIAPICDALAAQGVPGSAVYAIGSALEHVCSLTHDPGVSARALRRALRYLERALSRFEAEGLDRDDEPIEVLLADLARVDEDFACGDAGHGDEVISRAMRRLRGCEEAAKRAP